jgi:hypothetical protein
MSRMYIANCSQHDQTFLYKVPESQATYLQDIRAGQQVVLARELTKPDIDAIVEHHARYGMIEAGNAGRTRMVAPLLYSVDRQIALSRIQEQIRRNSEIQVAQGKDSRQLAAVQTNDYVEQQLRDMKLPDTLTEMSMEITEESRDTRTDASPQVAEGIRVTRNEPSDATPSRARRPRRRAADAINQQEH